MSGDIVNETAVEAEIVDEPKPRTIEDVEAELAALFPVEKAKAPFVPPKGATWAYATDMDTAERGVPDEWVWERLRLKRNALLSGSDWRMVQDAPWDTAAWVVYRQALRDLTENVKDPRTVVWPVAPK